MQSNGQIVKFDLSSGEAVLSFRQVPKGEPAAVRHPLAATVDQDEAPKNRATSRPVKLVVD